MTGKAAYIKAGYKSKGAAAEVNASRLLRNAKVAAIIDKVQEKALDKAEISQERILQEEAKLAFSNPKTPITFSDKGRSLERLERHLGMFEKDAQQLAVIILGPDHSIKKSPKSGIGEDG